MKFENSLNPEVKNLKNYFDSDNHSSVLMKNPRLVASGYLMDDPDWSSAPHVHDFVELIFCTGGHGRTTIYNQDYEIEPGDLIIHNPNTPHHESSDLNSPLEFSFVGLTDFQINGLPPNTVMDEKHYPVQKTLNYKEQFDTFFVELIKETLYRKEHFQLISEAICSCILAMTLRIMDGESTLVSTISSHSIRIKEYIDQNFTSDLNLSQLSSAVYISQTYISHIFKAEMGVSPIQYLINKRIAHAKHLLSTSDMPIAQIATECGYDDPVYFSQVFKRITEFSPKEYRKNGKKEDPE